MSTLTFTKGPIGYQADVDPSTGVTRWVIAHPAPTRWEIVSVRADGARIRHGAAHTLREAKEIVNHWHQANLASAQPVRRTIVEQLDAAQTGEEFHQVLNNLFGTLFGNLEKIRDKEEGR